MQVDPARDHVGPAAFPPSLTAALIMDRVWKEPFFSLACFSVCLIQTVTGAVGGMTEAEGLLACFFCKRAGGDYAVAQENGSGIYSNFKQ